MEAVELEITQHEATFLSDALSMFTQGPNPEVRAYPDLLLKIGAALLEMTPSHPVCCVALDRDELWMVREVAKTGVTVGSEKVGLNLLLKAYAGLRRLHAADDMHGVVAQLGESLDGTDELAKGDYRVKLNEWLERGGGNNARKG
jgi:hypothetical protein